MRFGERGTTFGDPIVATAIVDLLLHHSKTLNSPDESYRPTEQRRAALLSGRTWDGAQVRCLK